MVKRIHSIFNKIFVNDAVGLTYYLRREYGGNGNAALMSSFFLSLVNDFNFYFVI